MVRSIPSPSALYAGTEKHEDHTEVASLAKQMYLKRIHDERYGEENYYHPHQPRIVSASEDLVKDAAPFPFRNPVQDPRNDKEQVPTGQLAIRFRFRKWGCGSPAESWGFEARHLMPPEIESRMCREDWVAAIDEINNGYVKYPWPKLVWIPLVFGATVGAILEGSLRTIRYLPDGVVFSIFTAAGGARFLPPPPRWLRLLPSALRSRRPCASILSRSWARFPSPVPARALRRSLRFQGIGEEMAQGCAESRRRSCLRRRLCEGSQRLLRAGRPATGGLEPGADQPKGRKRQDGIG